MRRRKRRKTRSNHRRRHSNRRSRRRAHRKVGPFVFDTTRIQARDAGIIPLALQSAAAWHQSISEAVQTTSCATAIVGLDGQTVMGLRQRRPAARQTIAVTTQIMVARRRTLVALFSDAKVSLRADVSARRSTVPFTACLRSQARGSKSLLRPGSARPRGCACATEGGLVAPRATDARARATAARRAATTSLTRPSIARPRPNRVTPRAAVAVLRTSDVVLCAAAVAL